MAILTSGHGGESSLMNNGNGCDASTGDGSRSIDQRRDLRRGIGERHQQQPGKSDFGLVAVGQHWRIAGEFKVEWVARPAFLSTRKGNALRGQCCSFLAEAVLHSAGGDKPIDRPEQSEDKNEAQRQEHPPRAGCGIRHLIPDRLSR